MLNIMQTRILKKEDILIARDIITSWWLVAFPTETVYGLGANALDEKAVIKIFEAKWRPADNPLIVHIAEKRDIELYAINIPLLAHTLIDAFWPGPLTLVLEKKDIIPDITTAWLSTVCLRMPDHPLALELIRASWVPLAAPSANTSGRPSPTTHEHVLEDMDGKIDSVIAWEISDIGIESTVLDLTVSPPVILRHGWITEEMLREYTEISEKIDGKVAKSPGMKYRHYAPNIDIKIIEISYSPDILERIQEWENIWYLWIWEVSEFCSKNLFLFPTLEILSQNLFSTFRVSEKLWLSTLYIEHLGDKWLAMGIMNRVKKAASGK